MVKIELVKKEYIDGYNLELDDLFLGEVVRFKESQKNYHVKFSHWYTFSSEELFAISIKLDELNGKLGEENAK